QPAKPSSDCTEDASKLPRGTTRVFIGQQSGKDGSGRSASDARDGSSADKFDRILRCYAEGCAGGSGVNAVPKTEKLMVCIGPGKFQTKGRYDFVINVPHRTQEGFTIGKGWKIHGAGVQQTTVQLNAYRALLEDKNPENLPAKTGKGVVFHTNSDDASGI